MRTAGETYDQIGADYAARRRADQRWLTALDRALGDVGSIVNIGAGSGSYEPEGRFVVGVEPSVTMLRQRPRGAAPVVRAVAEALPFPDDRFAAAMAVLTVHHWLDPERGLREMCRVARRQVVLTWDPMVFARSFWLVDEYLPEIAEQESRLATLNAVCATLPQARVEPLPVPADCRDGFLGAFWGRPSTYLDPRARAAMSGLALLDAETVDDAMSRLQRDLADGTWMTRHADLLHLPEIDLGYRLVVADR